MEYDEYRDATAQNLDLFIDALRQGSLSEPVPGCPGWTVRDLAKHVGEFSAFWAHAFCEGTGRDKSAFPEAPDGEDMIEWVSLSKDLLLEEVEATPAETEVWTWYEPEQSARWAARRCANELAVHRYDAQSARGTSAPIEPELASDGIDEMLVVLTSLRERSKQAEGQTLHLHATDTDGEWLVTLLPDRVDVSQEHSKADLALRGPVSDLELLLYGRATLGEVERFGDESVLDAWRREFVF
jgi:uncharacterized protein (TIGR03083 family)